MPVRRGTSTRSRTTGKPAASSRGTARKAAPRKAAPAPVQERDVTVYAEKEPTPYHKAFATWLVKEVGYNPNGAASKREAFLAGVSMATVARTAFNNSEFIEEWREREGINKRGPKPQEQKRRSSRAAEPDDEFEDDTDDEEIDEDEEFDEDESDDDDDFDSDDEDDDDEDDEDDDDDEEEAPAPRSRRTSSRTSKAAPAKRAPTKSAGRTRSKNDDILF